jgi:cytochrome c5
MKHIVTLSLVSFLALGACSSGKTQHEESEEAGEKGTVTNAAKPEFDHNLTDPKLAAGEEVYESNCAGCHDSGTGGAPKSGVKDDWKERMAQGIPAMTTKSIEGFEGKAGAMPAKGGNAALTNEEVSNAVLYMVSKSR